ncbi:DUF4232 domain-containing protein [Cellulomonas sp. T2.31MG-18]|uniref:DUF4232 domain-containing protein n=1 Tax=Cellulomonas sp. T2.31MG-18 TaxID=3157619 RepID=UPI00366ECCBF
MTSPRRRPAGRRLLASLAPAALAIALAGCSGGTTPGSAGPTGTAPGTPAGSGSSSTPVPSSATGGRAPSTPTASTTAASGTGSAPGGCTSAHLSASLVPGGAAAGSTMPVLVLTNTGSDTCTLQGWPGVSFVGGGNGTQLGAAADRDDTGSHTLVTLAPGAAAHVPMRIANAQNYDAAACNPVPADGLRVYPPGQKDALFVSASGLTACRSDVQHLISVQAVQPGAS